MLNANIRRLQVGSADGGSRKVFVIDEIGKMELFSQSFIRAVRQTLDSSSCTILGTIPVPKGKPLGLVEEVRSRSDVKVFTVSTILAHFLGEGVRDIQVSLRAFKANNSYRTVFTLYPLGLRRAVSLLSAH